METFVSGLSISEEAKAYILEKIKKPSEVHLESDSRCNARCIMCPRTGMERYQGPMRQSLFYKIIEDLIPDPPELLHFHLNGEALMIGHRELAHRIEYAKTYLPGSKMIIFTNASLLTEEASRFLIGSPLDEIAFSVDGGTKEDYEKVRKGLHWETTLKNIAYFVNQNMINHKIKTHCFIVPLKENRGSIDKFHQLFKSMGVDNVGGSGVINIGGLVDADSLRTDLQYMGGNINSPCWRIFVDIDVMADGNVPVCCQDVRGRLIMGNARTENLLDVWKGSFNELRKKFLLGKRSEIPVCQDCDFMRSFCPPEFWKF